MKVITKVKLRSLVKFLNDGDKTKVTVRYRGREMAHREIGMDLLKRIEKDLEENSHCRSNSENGRATNDYGYVTQKEKITTTKLHCSHSFIRVATSVFGDK